MKADKNTIIGFVLIGLLFFGYFWFNKKENDAYVKETNRRNDSIAKVEAAKITPEMRAKAKVDSLRNDSLNKISTAGNYANAAIGNEELTVIENELMKVTFTNKGGRVKFVELKNYKSYDGGLVKMGSENDSLGYNIVTGNNRAANTNGLFFKAAYTAGSKTISYTLADSAGQNVVHEFVIKPKEYMIDWNVKLAGADRLLSNGLMNIAWQSQTMQHESSAKYERAQMSNICFVEDGNFDYISSKTEHTFEKPTHWMSVVQQFFNTTLIAKNNFNSGKVVWARNAVDSSHVLARVDANFQMKVAGANATVPFQLYYGPSDYKVLAKEGMEMDRIINLGRDMYSFVRPINEYIIMPVFNFFASFIKNYGWVILLLTLFIRLVTSPLTYGSYLNGAKMKILRPELDELKKKYGSDQQGFAMAQMKFNKEAGVNMLGGCLPALLQIPIFFALYSFFNSNIALRGQDFLWSKDLSAYDTILTWNTSVLGMNHLSLFTITAVLTSFLISIYNMSMTPSQDNPALKYMPYIFPFVLFFVFNNLPSALTWYYTVSNIITLALQFVIQNYIINHDKILANIEEKRKNPKVKAKSKWQERYDQMLESQKKLQDMKNKTKK
jgi:YidC/Oxa1 family membrane protein insertase